MIVLKRGSQRFSSLVSSTYVCSSNEEVKKHSFEYAGFACLYFDEKGLGVEGFRMRQKQNFWIPRRFNESRAVERDFLSKELHSHSMVAGGLLVISYTTRFTPGTSFTIRLLIRASTESGRRAQSAVMKSSVVTARSAIVSA
jgi:hypothetical protein